MTERKTTDRKTALAIFRRLDAGNVPAPWVPPELPAAKTDDRIGKLKPWVPAELPASNAVPPAKNERAVARLKPWVPPAETPRNLPAVKADDLPAVPDDEPQRRKKKGKRRAGELTETVHQAGHTTINIVNQVAAPAPVYVSPWWGWWGRCPNFSCPRHAGRVCLRVWCGWW